MDGAPPCLMSCLWSETKHLTFEDVDSGIQKLKRALVHVFISCVKGFYVKSSFSFVPLIDELSAV